MFDLLLTKVTMLQVLFGEGEKMVVEKVSYIIPCYRSEKALCVTVGEILSTMEDMRQYRFEIILVCDGSPDNTAGVIKSLAKEYEQVKGINLAKNFGQHSAIMAGINYASGDTFVFLDDDGQNPPREVKLLLDALGDDCDVAMAGSLEKKQAFWRNFGSDVNSFMAKVLVGKPPDLVFSSYWACKHFVVEEIKKFDGPYPYIGGLLLRCTDKLKNVPIEHREREDGISGYTLGKLLSLWLNGFTAFSVKPLRIATLIGVITAGSGFSFGTYIILRRLTLGPHIAVGWSSIMAALLLIGGMIMLMLGLIGEYIGRTYIYANKSPQFIVRERFGFDDVE